MNFGSSRTITHVIKIAIIMSSPKPADSSLQQVISQLYWSKSAYSSSDASGTDPSEAPFSSDTKDSWLHTYRNFRKPLSVSSWKWAHEKRPGKFCDAHLVDFFSCLDHTKDKLGMDALNL